MTKTLTGSSGGKFRFPLDFSLPTSEERKAYVDNLIAEQMSYPYAQNQPNLLYLFTQKELETFSNYILYGKDEDTLLTTSSGKKVGGTSSVDRGEIAITSKYASYSRKPTESLNSLMESPTFNETDLSPIRPKTNKFIVPKTNFSREKARAIPGLAEELEPLWSEIDRIDRLLLVNSGDPTKIERVRALLIDELGETEGNNALAHLQSQTPLDSLRLYKLKHLLIDLRKQQYILKDCFAPATQLQAQKTSYCADDDLGFGDWSSTSYSIYPLGPYSKGDLKFESPTDLDFDHKQYPSNFDSPTIDFTNPEHIHSLYNNYLELEAEVLSNPLSTCGDLIYTLNFYRSITPLSPSYERILDLKIKRYTNARIAEIVNQEFGLHHTENYISTIYCKKICEAISEAAQLNYDGYLKRFDPFQWKVCTGCHQKKLKDTRNFTRKARSSDGLTSRCKICEKEERQNRR